MAQPQSQQVDLPSGAVLSVTVAPFIDAWRLTQAALKTLRGMSLGPQDLQKNAAGKMSVDPGLLIDRAVELATSPEVEAAIWKCAERALYRPAGSQEGYAGEKITRSLFDDPNHGGAAREDFVNIAKTLLEVNCEPFLVRVLSELRASGGSKVAVPASK